MRQWRGASPSQKTAEVRLYMLARGWLAYPVTSGAHTATAEVRLYKKRMEPSITLDSIPQKIIYSLFCQFQNCVVIELQYVDAFREV